ncbi:MAG: DNA recombination protein RmuC [Nitrosopumilus sp.]|nr:DNA recombination protein RmuC [Candidatus Nitrosopumilus limneticus]
MYVVRTSEIKIMTDFDNFYHDLIELIKKYENDLALKIEEDLEHDIIKIFGTKITSLTRAQNGLNDVTELAYTTAEHHPYWNLLYNCSEITHTLLDNWEKSLSSENVADIKWALKEINQTLEKIKNNSNVSHSH